MVFGSSVYFLGEGRKHSATGAWVRVEFLELGVEREASLMPQMLKKKKSALDAGDPGLIPGSGRSPGAGNGNLLQYSCLENPMERNPGGYSPWGCKETDTTN